MKDHSTSTCNVSIWPEWWQVFSHDNDVDEKSNVFVGNVVSMEKDYN